MIYINPKARLIKSSLFLYFIFFYSLTGYGQDFIGRIVDKETKLSIEFAYIIYNDTLHTISNSEGLFNFKKISPSASAIIKVQMLGYKQLVLENLISLMNDTLVFELTPISIVLEEIVVKDKREREFTASEIVEIAIDSLYTSSNQSSKKNVSGYYTQTHHSIPQIGYEQIGKYSLNPKLDSIRKYHYLIQAYISFQSIDSISIHQLRRSFDQRKYKHAYSSGKGRGFRMDYENTNTAEEREKAIIRERNYYDLKGFYTIDPIRNHDMEVDVDKIDKFYLLSGTYGYLNRSFVKTHSFKIDGIIDDEGEKIVRIKILPSRKSYQHGKFSKHHWIPVGMIYIRLSDFGIMRMEYSYILNPKQTNFAAFATTAMIGLPILFKDIILYKEVDNRLELAYISRFQQDIDVNMDDDDNPEEKRYYYVEREFFTSQFSSHAKTSSANINSIYDDYTYDTEFWDNTNLKILNTKDRKKMLENLEEEGQSLSNQFIKNSKN